MGDLMGQNNFNMGGKNFLKESITKELLAATNKEIIEDDLGMDEGPQVVGQLDHLNDNLEQISDYDQENMGAGMEEDFQLQNMDAKGKPRRDHLQIDIDENADYEQ